MWSPPEHQPLWLLAELTYACPLRCPYCSNPADFARQGKELSTDDWLRVLRQARTLGISQLGFSGGEPLVRQDLELLVEESHRLGFYTNLITSGLRLDEARLDRLRLAGLDNIQISLQASTRELNDRLAGVPCFEAKQKVAKAVKERGFSLGINVVLHRHNLGEIDRLMDLALSLEADYVELANSQYYGFALLNRQNLLPSRAQVEKAEERVRLYQELYGRRTRFIFVLPDYYTKRPKACMNGWAKIFLLVTPDGTALPCHSARVLPGLVFPNVKDHPLAWIWGESPAFRRFRGYEWMEEPCRSCPERFQDFAGCRCQAYLLTQNPNATDPACELAPSHGLITAATAEASGGPQAGAEEATLISRTPRNSLRYSSESTAGRQPFPSQGT